MIQPLTQLKIGHEATISAIHSTEEARLNALSVFGIVPDSKITLRQRHSACVVTIGETDVALDLEIAGEIMVCES
jgi:Fe2+ transport system protein FeoA